MTGFLLLQALESCNRLLRPRVGAVGALGTGLVAVGVLLCAPATSHAATMGASANELQSYRAPCPSSGGGGGARIGPVTHVGVIGGPGGATVHWCPPSSGSSRVTGYSVHASSGETIQVRVPNTWAIFQGLKNGRSVRFSVRAIAAGGKGPARSTKAVTPEPVKAPVHVRRGRSCRVGYDHYSLKICGKRVFIFAGEFHPWRLPSPALWRDRLQKLKAAGFNAVTIYLNWAYHSPDPGVYDFSGVRDLNRFLNMAQQVGLYVVARVGPYINAEANAGGFPGWLTTESGKARTTAADYTRAWKQWYARINPIIAAHQITRGGDVILYQIENELSVHDADTERYMKNLATVARDEGIRVPLFTQYTQWAKGPGAPDLYGLDLYPLAFNCARTRLFPNPPATGDKHNLGGNGKPLFLSEYQGGGFDGWGGSGYGACYRLTGPNFENIFYDQNIASGATLMNYYMSVGGTSWGWLGDPHVYTSYDYGASIRESGEIGTPVHPDSIQASKYGEEKLIAYRTQSLGALTKTEAVASPPRSTNSQVKVQARENPDTGTLFLYLRDKKAASNQTIQMHLKLPTPGGVLTIPQKKGTAMTLIGRQALSLVANERIGSTRLIYSTSQVMLKTRVGRRNFVVFYGAAGSSGETELKEPVKPTVRTITGDVAVHWDSAAHHLRLDYTHSYAAHGLQEVEITRSGARPLVFLIMPRRAAQSLWLAHTQAGNVIVDGSYLLRAAETRNRSGSNHRLGVLGVGSPPVASSEHQLPRGTLALFGDSTHGGALRIFAPSAIKHVRWNGRALTCKTRPDGALEGHIPRAASVHLPVLGMWYEREGAPETRPGFDDSKWPVADHMVTTSPLHPATLPVLYADDYGFHYGFIWYRGRFMGRRGQTGVSLKANGGGPSGAFSVWLNGHYLGSDSSGGRSDEVFHFPSGAVRRGKSNVLSVLVLDTAHNEDGASRDRQKAPRGLLGASIVGTRSSIRWRLQGSRPWESTYGSMNASGLFGGAHHWDRTGHGGGNWKRISHVQGRKRPQIGPGVHWYKTTFSLHFPDHVYAPVGVQIAGPGPSVGARRYQALIYLNGWLMGRYANYLGPQHDFYLPAGVLHHHGKNVLALALWTMNRTSTPFPRVKLISLGVQAGGLGTWNGVGNGTQRER